MPAAPLTPSDRLIVALDVPTVAEARAVADGLGRALGEAAGFYKIGYQLMPIGGYGLAADLSAAGQRVFLDAKLFDIGATVERGVRSMTTLNADFLTVHADPDTIRGAVAGRGDDARLKLLAVTVLTSWDERALRAHGLSGSVDDLVLKRAEMAAEHGADGVIASAREAAMIKARFGDALEIVTPGIRPKGTSTDDQARVVTPADAIAAGASRLVVGRPIVKAADPSASAQAILSEIAAVS